MLEAVIRRRGKRTACLRLGHHVADIRAGNGFGLHDDGPVQMLTALGSQIDALRLEGFLDPFINGLAQLRAGVAADFMTGDFAGGAAHHQDLALPQFCHLTNLQGGGLGLVPDLL